MKTKRKSRKLKSFFTFAKSFTVSFLVLFVITSVIYFVGIAATRTKAVGFGDNRPAIGGKTENNITTIYFFDYQIDFGFEFKRIK